MPPPYRVAVIGRTGRGNYGHSLDVAWKTHPRAQVIAVADDNPQGLTQAAERLQTNAAYSDWRKMLRDEKPAIVVVAPRHIDCHLEMALGALEARAHVFLEKPFARTPAECDQIIDAADRAHLRVTVAHNMRSNPILDYVQQRLAAGLIGEILEIRGRGKEDKRAGGEDLMVLGTHIFDLMRRFAGDPLWAFGRVATAGRELTRADVIHGGPEGLGPIAGDAISGTFGFPSGLTGYFASRRSNETSGRRWGVDLYGTEGVLAIRANHVPEIWLCRASRWVGEPWQRLEFPSNLRPKDVNDANHLLVEDLLDAIENGREPHSGGRTARWTIEMAMSLYASQRAGGRVRLPLEKRTHPLEG